MRPRIAISTTALASAALLLLTASAQAKLSGPNSFEGTCHLSGDFVFDRPIGPLPQTMSFEDSATGTCSGKLNGVQRDDIPVVNTVSGWGTFSCSSADAHTADTLMFDKRYP